MSLYDKVLKMGFKKAESLIRTGYVKVNNQICYLPSQKISNLDYVSVKEKSDYVSRGALKLLAAYENFELDFKGKTILDIGASKGGFTQICLKKGAKKVYALDSGTNQLDYSLRINPKVFVKEKTNIKHVNKGFFDDKIDLIVCDVSFISLKKVLDVVKNLLDEGKNFIALLKPQFEASSKYVQKGGKVAKEYHKFLIDRIVKFAKPSFELKNFMESPIKGLKSKNTEYFLHFVRKNDWF
ncbi:TlyA family RNA methyltransferase [Mycoplasma flocculare]|uniref:TlyA family RNA methyltransferase n=1 Tax=Mesomycoplasma flocculare TaxID=2128 RepID=A0AAW9XGC4_MESFC|nr:TlyA family RNA methyltransferase [Mesomycoplasma flocculare]MXR39440.1 TlyA family RNA methyltransferase [Mycoplasma sp. MF12]MXR05849.1 TlyA family RNA methyltransferase [Mesomycoplasma flocculare]MXR12261.1 TlyA family RNA methyltransferase [Mesomycoplasma flocculare]MXR56251.1 TlyA family RNA methyltransferase [Mesomycoplasma flocculare]MXR56675.1 TlyA family RNA methyltransferase [Mesomycoplasma flocculare]